MKFITKTFITKLSVACASIAILASTASYAGTVTVSSSQLNDYYVGADGNWSSSVDHTPNNAAGNYDTHWMQVERIIKDGTVGSLVVTVNSNFVAYNNSTSLSFGDLFIMDAEDYTLAEACTAEKYGVDDYTARGCNEYTEQTNSQNVHGTVQSVNNWQYAFDLGGERQNSYDDNVTKGGKLKEIDQGNYEESIVSTTNNREWQAIMVNDNADGLNTVGNGTWNTNVSEKLLTMTFDISGTSLMGAAQIALRWQMTCANDIIEVVTNFANSGNPMNNPTSVSEPETLALMLLAGFGLFASRKKKMLVSKT